MVSVAASGIYQLEEKNETAKTVPGAPGSDELNEIRTFLALDRTLLAWVRTALTMVGAGFTVAKFLRGLIEKAEVIGMPKYFPLHLGYALIGLGMLGLLGGVAQYISIGKRIPRGGSIWSVTLIVTLGLAVLSLWLLGILIYEVKTT